MVPIFYFLELFCKFLLRFILYRVFRYRLKVVRYNLGKSFPSVPAKLLAKYEYDFYRNFADVLVESVMSLFVSRSFLLSRVKVINPELLTHIYNRNISSFFLGGHISNWEWGGMAVGNYSHMYNLAVYLPLKNSWADKVMRKSRSRLTKVDALVASSRLFRALSVSPRPFQVYILSDQSPPKNSFVRVPFLNSPTAFFAGTPKMIRKLRTGLVYLETSRVRSGYYEVRLTLLSEDGSLLTEEDLTLLYAKALETSILKAPSDWLWSHKRWKF